MILVFGECWSGVHLEPGRNHGDPDLSDDSYCLAAERLDDNHPLIATPEQTNKLMELGVISPQDVDEWEREKQERRRLSEEREAKQDLVKYLELKKRFEPN